MSLHLGCIFIYLLNLLGWSYLVSDSFFSERSLPRSNPAPLITPRWRNIFPNEESLLNPILRNSQRDNLYLPPQLNYPTLFPEIFNDTKSFSNVFLDNKPLRESISLFDLLQKNVRDDIIAKTKNLTEIRVEDDELTEDVDVNHKTEESEIRGVATVKYEGKDRKIEERNYKNETVVPNEGIKTKNKQESSTDLEGIGLEKEENDDETGTREGENKENGQKNENKTEMNDATTVKYEGKDTEKEEISRKSENGREKKEVTAEDERNKSEKKEDDRKNVEELEERQLISKSESFDQDVSKDKGKNFNDEEKEEENMKHVFETSSIDKVDDVERSSKDIRIEEVTTAKTDLKNVIESGEDSNIEKEKETKNEGENRKINLKAEIEDGETNLEKNRKQIMSVENKEERSESKKVKASHEETNRKIEESNEENVPESELNEIKMEDTRRNDQFFKNINERSDNGTNKNQNLTEINDTGDLNEKKGKNGKVQETLRETLPDELSNSDLDVLQDNSTNFVCLTDSSKCLSKSTSILLTTGILIGIIVGLVTIVGITTGLSVYIFHRWKLRKKPRDKSRTSKTERIITSTTRRPAKNRSTKRKLNLGEVVEENDSPVNTLEAITVHNYSEDGRNYNL